MCACGGHLALGSAVAAPAPSAYASDDLSLTLGIAIGVPLGAAYLAVHKSAVVPVI